MCNILFYFYGVNCDHCDHSLYSSVGILYSSNRCACTIFFSINCEIDGELPALKENCRSACTISLSTNIKAIFPDKKHNWFKRWRFREVYNQMSMN